MTVDNRRLEIGARHDFGESFDWNIRSLSNANGIDYFRQIVRRNLGAIPTAIPSEPLIKRFGTRAGKTSAHLRVVVVWLVVDCFSISASSHLSAATSDPV